MAQGNIYTRDHCVDVVYVWPSWGQTQQARVIALHSIGLRFAKICAKVRPILETCFVLWLIGSAKGVDTVDKVWVAARAQHGPNGANCKLVEKQSNMAIISSTLSAIPHPEIWLGESLPPFPTHHPKLVRKCLILASPAAPRTTSHHIATSLMHQCESESELNSQAPDLHASGNRYIIIPLLCTTWYTSELHSIFMFPKSFEYPGE